MARASRTLRSLVSPRRDRRAVSLADRVLPAIPFLIVLRISLSQIELAQPPYSPVFDPSAGWQGLKNFISALSFDNFRTLFGDWLYVSVLCAGA